MSECAGGYKIGSGPCSKCGALPRDACRFPKPDPELARLRAENERLRTERDTAWAELRGIREAIFADPEESTLDEVRAAIARLQDERNSFRDRAFAAESELSQVRLLCAKLAEGRLAKADGYTIIDFLRLWHDQQRARADTLAAAIERKDRALRELCEACERAAPEGNPWGLPMLPEIERAHSALGNVREEKPWPDPLGEALNSGDGVYRP